MSGLARSLGLQLNLTVQELINIEILTRVGIGELIQIDAMLGSELLGSQRGSKIRVDCCWDG
jgi:hypothetical protein